MFSLLHESVHGIGHSNRHVNEWLGRIAAAFFPTALSIQRVFHLGHHAHNRTALEQFDYVHPGDRKLLKYAQWYTILTGVYWLFVPLGTLLFAIWPRLLERLATARYAEQTGASSVFAGLEHAPRTRVRLEVLLTVAIQATLWLALDLRPGGWLACYAAFAINWSSLQYADHAFSALDVRNGAWNLRVNPLTRLLFLNYHHHLAHHQHPHVPWLHLGTLVDRRVERPWFWRIYLSMWRGPRTFPR